MQASFSLSLGELQVLPVLHDVVEELASGGVFSDEVEMSRVFDDLGKSRQPHRVARCSDDE